MKRITRFAAVCVLTAAVGTGCASISLFSGTHKHYHENKETEKGLKSAKQRLERLEKRIGPPAIDTSVTETARHGQFAAAQAQIDAAKAEIESARQGIEEQRREMRAAKSVGEGAK